MTDLILRIPDHNGPNRGFSTYSCHHFIDLKGKSARRHNWREGIVNLYRSCIKFCAGKRRKRAL